MNNAQYGTQPPPGGPGAYPQQQWQPQPPPKKKNWFLRHKFLTAFLVLVVIIAAASAGQKGKDTGSPEASGKSSGQTSASAASSGSTSQPPAPVGTPVRDGKFEFTVTKVVRGQKTVGAQYIESHAQGSFTLVYVTVKNIGTEQQGLSDSDQKATDAAGTQYSPDSGADASIQGNEVLFTQINPGNQVKGVIAFDAPADKKLTKIELHDSMFSGGVQASL